MKSKKLKIAVSIMMVAILSASVVAAQDILTTIDFQLGDMEFTSSQWTDPEIVSNNEMVSSYRVGRIWEVEYYNATISLRNNGYKMKNTNVTITLNYSGKIIERIVELGLISQDEELSIRLDFLPGSGNGIMDWSYANAVLSLEAHGFAKKLLQEMYQVPIVAKGKNFDAPPADPVNHDINDNNTGLGLNALLGEVLDMWIGDSTLTKGEGPQAKVKVKFNWPQNGVSIEYKFQSTDHWWIDNYVHYWSGSFSMGSIWIFTLNFGWNFDNSKYVFGQANYQFYSAKAYGSNWADTEYRDGSNDDFTVSQHSTEHRVFLHVIYDSYVTSNINCLERSASAYISDGTAEFNNHDSFDINYYIVLKHNNWLGAHGGGFRYGTACGQSGIVYVADEDNGELRAANKNAHAAILGIDYWQSGSRTYSRNHGFDQILGMSGLVRSYDSDHNGKAGAYIKPGNDGWVLAGVEYELLFPFVYPIFVGDDKFDNHIQHELSHGWDAADENYWDCVMNVPLENYNFWYITAANKISSSQSQFDNIP